MESLPIVWKRLVNNGETCVRCAGTQDEVELAVATLGGVLEPLSIRPQLTVQEIDDPTFQANPTESNRIWISGKPLEDWLQAGVGSSRCCSVCGDSDCRTVQLGPTTYEVIPERLIHKAALVAAAELIDAERR